MCITFFTEMVQNFFFFKKQTNCPCERFSPSCFFLFSWFYPFVRLPQQLCVCLKLAMCCHVSMRFHLARVWV